MTSGREGMRGTTDAIRQTPEIDEIKMAPTDFRHDILFTKEGCKILTKSV